MEELKKEVEEAIKDADFIKDVDFIQPLSNKRGKPSLNVAYKDIISGESDYTVIVSESSILEFIQTVNKLKSVFKGKEENNSQHLRELKWLEAHGFKHDMYPVRFTDGPNFLINTRTFDVTSTGDETNTKFLHTEIFTADNLKELSKELNKKLQEKEAPGIYIYKNSSGSILSKHDHNNKVIVKAAIIDRKEIE